MNERSQPWAERFRPRSIGEIVGNKAAVDELLRWLRSWRRGTPKRRAAFLFGPPGTGKTAAVQAVARELGYDLLEVNASDHRTKNRMEDLIGRAALQTLSVLGRRRMILFDEMEGVSGRQDRGGIAAIADIIRETRSPVILIATTISENMEDKFRPLRGRSLPIEFKPIPFADILARLQAVAEEVGVQVDEEVLVTIAMRTGDLRSAINDLESIARGKKRVTIDEVEWIGERDRKEYTPEALRRIFSARTLTEARKAVSTSMMGYDDLFDWIYENLPLVLDDPRDLAEGLDALARADIHQNRARRSQAYRLLKYMFDEMTGGVALSRSRSEGGGLIRQVRTAAARSGLPPSAFTVDEAAGGMRIRPNRWLGKEKWDQVNAAFRAMGGRWVYDEKVWAVPYFRPPQIKWRYYKTKQSRRMRRSIAERVAEKCHVSGQEAVAEVIPLLKVIFQGDERMAGEIAGWLGLEGRETEWLRA